MTATVLRGDARHLPLPDSSVDLIVTSPPYFALRSYQDGGEHYSGQIGSEATPAEFLDALICCTREMMRVLKPSGSIFVNLGDKYAGGGMGGHSSGLVGTIPQGTGNSYRRVKVDYPNKSLMGLPWRYAIRCIDQLGLILRAEVIWSKPNGLPESVTDRPRRSHEQWFMFTKLPRYYAAVDTIREPQITAHIQRHNVPEAPRDQRRLVGAQGLHDYVNPLGKLPGSVWQIPSQPLSIPAWVGVDHFAAFPMELPRRIILGWSPSGICCRCGEGRRPVADKSTIVRAPGDAYAVGRQDRRVKEQANRATRPNLLSEWSITGEVCACTPYTDHPGTGERSPIESSRTTTTGRHGTPGQNSRPHQNPVGPWREYHFDRWTPPPTRPAVCLDPFGGTGTVALMADVLGRHGITVDMSADYSRAARWRTTDPGERARAMQVDKPEPVPDGQLGLFEGVL